VLRKFIGLAGHFVKKEGKFAFREIFLFHAMKVMITFWGNFFLIFFKSPQKVTLPCTAEHRACMTLFHLSELQQKNA
jgi:hypothetical protein